MIATIHQIFIQPTVKSTTRYCMLEEYQRFLELTRQVVGCDDVCLVLCLPGFHQKIQRTSSHILSQKHRMHQLKEIDVGEDSVSVLTLNLGPEDTNIAQQQYLFKKRRQLEIGIYRERYVLRPVFDSDNQELLLCIQCTRREVKDPQGNVKSVNEFNEFDHSKIDLMACFLRQRVEGQIYRMDALDKKDKIFHIMESCNKILDKKTPVEVIMSMRKELSTLFEFEAVNVLFYDEHRNDLYSHLLDLDKTLKEQMQDGTAKIKMRFPLGMGCTGQAFERRKLMFTNKVESEAMFNDDIDNILKLKPIKNMVVFEVSSWELSKDHLDSKEVSVGVI